MSDSQPVRRRRKRRAQPIVVDDRVHPLIKRLFEQMAASGMDETALASRAGVHIQSLRSWRLRNVSPTLHLLDAAYSAVGLQLDAHP